MGQGPILVTGAGGFVCSEVAVSLARAGADVIALDQSFDAELTRRLEGIRLVQADLRHGVPGGIGPVSSVLHGAAITASPEQLRISRAGHIRRNMDMLTAALEFAQTAGAEGFVFLSSMGVFEPHDGPLGEKVTEATLPTGTCPYAAAKRAGELLTTSARAAGFRTFSLRLGNVFGPHEAIRETRQHLCLLAGMISQAQATGVISVETPKAKREWAWLPDLAAAVAQLITDMPIGGPSVLHAGTPPGITDIDLARQIAARVPGTTLRQKSPPHDPVRPPMGSDAASVFDAVAWTGIADALDRLIPAEVIT